MSADIRTDGIVAGRLDPAALEANFADLHPPLDAHEALVAADRCYFCHDAPCVTACPTGIDIPLFIRQIATGQPDAAARTILSQNILGGMCARVCPTETLCEEACVREAAEGKPVLIGQLQRHATDSLMAKGVHPFARAAETGKSIAVVGAGPAGLAAAHRLSMHGHAVTIYEAKPKGGGLNEYGIAAYKTVDGFAQAELEWLLKIGGISIQHGAALGGEITLETLAEDHDAVLLAMGLAGVNALGLKGADRDWVRNAVDFIAELRQTDDLSKLSVGRRVVVIGGGMTAVDAAVQSKLLGADEVTIVYRRDRDAMPASRYEQDLAASRGVRLVFNAQPIEIKGRKKDRRRIVFAYTERTGKGVRPTGERFTLHADQLLLAIGQTLEGAPDTLAIEGGKLRVEGAGRTSLPGVWAAGDCASGGDDLTVTAVAEGRDAAEDIHAALMG
ncbi:NAD(P)-dependent oxidoreductase [Halovulum dunhuangense]|uniref:NAD(P)-dependent oxidoreductase n=1 Tax=Halovulum dunhuangense TaxID=1505036 RepID=A0A849KZD6_9RHOB|nr:NAD(P)-dependent oxidoreductase [Halovulum dunhuangense]NNU79502.1 NAD(P)-dependent oxidoreductase [Halovulum dunhuangense]